MESPRVTVSVEGHVAHVRLNRPEKRNGLDLAMFEGLVAAGERVRADRSVRCVVLAGEGKGFCAGLDWESFLAMGSDAAAKLLHRDEAVSPANLAQRACFVWLELEVPVIAAVHGAAIGGGLQLALACDVRLVAPDAKLSVMEVRYGLVPDMTASQTLLRFVRSDVARELMFTGRIVDGEEAARIGLATRVASDPTAEATELAKAIAANSPHAVRAAKKLAATAPGASVAEALRLETELQLGLMGSENQREAVMAALSKRPGNFSDPT